MSLFKSKFAVQTQTQLKSSHQKNFIRSLQQQYGNIDEAIWKEIFPSKISIIMCKLTNKIALYCIKHDNKNDLKPLFFKVPFDNEEIYYPTLNLLWDHPNFLTCIYIIPHVSYYILRGADLMIPGVSYKFHQYCNAIQDDQNNDNNENCQTQLNIQIIKKIKKYDILSIKIVGNDLPIGIGYSLMNGNEIMKQINSKQNKGRFLKLIHYYGDHLWHYGGSIKPNAGFLNDHVQPIYNVSSLFHNNNNVQLEEEDNEIKNNIHDSYKNDQEGDIDGKDQNENENENADDNVINKSNNANEEDRKIQPNDNNDNDKQQDLITQLKQLTPEKQLEYAFFETLLLYPADSFPLIASDVYQLMTQREPYNSNRGNNDNNDGDVNESEKPTRHRLSKKNKKQKHKQKNVESKQNNINDNDNDNDNDSDNDNENLQSQQQNQPASTINIDVRNTQYKKLARFVTLPMFQTLIPKVEESKSKVLIHAINKDEIALHLLCLRNNISKETLNSFIQWFSDQTNNIDNNDDKNKQTTNDDDDNDNENENNDDFINSIEDLKKTYKEWYEKTHAKNINKTSEYWINNLFNGWNNIIAHNGNIYYALSSYLFQLYNVPLSKINDFDLSSINENNNNAEMLTPDDKFRIQFMATLKYAIDPPMLPINISSLCSIRQLYILKPFAIRQYIHNNNNKKKNEFENVT